ncbi:helix-turn-helix domain-containing protein [Actinoplanes sp. NPDC000266]
MTGTPSFAAMLRELRSQAGLTMDELAATSGVSARAISDMERGRSRRPQRRTIAALADALGLDLRQGSQLIAAARGRPLLPLPEDAEPFVGREAELTRLRQLARQALGERTAPVVVICGLGGTGKTALAVRAARSLAAEFPGGAHFADMSGGTGDDLLRALGVPERDIPAGAEDRAGHYRETVRERAALVVLDDAVDEARVRPLLPADGAVLTLVTSRRLLSGLEAVHRVHLGPLEPADAARLVDGEVAALCGFLPLALRVAAGQTAGDLATADRRLDRLADLGFPVNDVLARPYRALTPPAALALRRLARYEAVDDEDALEELVEAGLAEIGSGGYRLHELVRLFAGRSPG